MLTLNADQVARARRSHLAKVDLVTLAQGGTTVRLAGVGVRFDGDIYEPFLSSVERTGVSINHLPVPDDLQSLTQPLEVEISNEPRAAERVFAYLETQLGGCLEGATMEWSQILTEDRPTTAFWDLSALAAAERTVRWTGVVRQCGPIQNSSIRLRGEIDLPTYEWPVANHADTPPDFVGVRLPVVLGDAIKVQAVNYETGADTTILSDLSSTEDNVEKTVTDASRFPDAGTFTVEVGTEQITMSKVDDTTLNVETSGRGINSTTATAHFSGDQVRELKTAVFILNAVESASVGTRYARSTAGPLVSFSVGTVDLSDTTTISGSTVTSLTLTGADLASLNYLLSLKANDAAEPTLPTTLEEAPPDEAAVGGGGGLGFNNCTVDTLGSRIFGFEYPEVAEEPIDLDWASGTLNSTQAVIRWRTKTTVSWAGVSAGSCTFKTLTGVHSGNWPDTPPPDKTLWQSPLGASGSVSYESAWQTPSGSVFLDDLVGVGKLIRIGFDNPGGSGIGGGATFTFSNVSIEADVDVATFVPDTATTSASRLEIYADMTGGLAPASATPDYFATDGEAVKHPMDGVRWWIEVIGGGAIDDTQWAVLIADVDASLLISGDLRTAGSDYPEVLARLGFEAGANIVPRLTGSGNEWRIMAPRSDGTWFAGATALAELSEWDRGGVAQVGRDILTDVFSRLAFVYAPDNSIESGSPFTGLLIANPSASDLDASGLEVTAAELTALEADIGVRVAETQAFRLIQDEHTAKTIAGYYASERTRLPSLFAIAGATWWESYDVEVGDFLSMSPPWSATDVDCRVIDIAIDPSTEQRELRLLQVRRGNLLVAFDSVTKHTDADGRDGTIVASVPGDPMAITAGAGAGVYAYMRFFWVALGGSVGSRQVSRYRFVATTGTCTRDAASPATTVQGRLVPENFPQVSGSKSWVSGGDDVEVTTSPIETGWYTPTGSETVDDLLGDADGFVEYTMEADAGPLVAGDEATLTDDLVMEIEIV
jgi:hypothetical protein